MAARCVPSPSVARARALALTILPALATASLATPARTQEPTPAIDMSLLGDIEARAIGPAVVGGRIGAVAGVPGDPTIVWAGASAGGVWKSTDGGVTFEPVFDDQDVASIGAIAVHPTATDIVWVGSGEGNPRNSASVGRGIYRTTDGGRSWTKLGLDKTERIHRIVLHPDDADVAWVSAFGTSWGENEQRGVFKTTDGGATWTKVLYVDERTGCSDLILDPRNPDKLFASMWQHRRWPWAFESGGPGSGLYRTLDGGETWTRLGSDDGLPKGELGRIGLAIAASDPDVVYALTEAKKSVLLRSDDGGFRFRTVNGSDGIAPRPFYFCDIRVDPRDPNRVYNMHTVIDVSTDGGRSFETLVGWNAAHPDHHSMWIDPRDPQRILIGNDGGVYTSRDRGAHWRFCANLPLAQFYHVAVDDDVPYHVYGGLQDNGSWRGPANVWENGGIRNLHWQEVCFGDGFATIPDPSDSRQGYAMSQGGSLVRWDLRDGSRKSIRPPAPEDVELRWHWNAAIALNPFADGTVYYGSQFVHKSTDRGDGWQVISPDLTTDNPEWQKQEESGGLTIDVTAAENHCTILTIAPSAVQQGVIWAGTDDGRVHVTRDGGESWTSVEANVPGRPRNTWCPHIEASKFDAATAFAVFDGHRNSDWTSYVYVTRDFGATWVSIATEAIDGYCHVIEQDPVQKDLLWVGTEFGLFVTFDGGKQWHAWRHGVPTCAARAITTQERDGDLVVATHGRSIFVIDDLAALRAMSPELLQKKLHVFAPRTAIMHGVSQTPSTRFPGQGEFRGETARRGLLLQFVANAPELKHPDPKVEKTREKPKASKPGGSDEGDASEVDDDAPKDKVTIEVRDAAGALVRTFRADAHLGLNRVYWRFERDGVQGPSRNVTKPPKLPRAGRPVLPGNYRITVRFQGTEQVVEAVVQPDPRVEIAMDDRRAKDALRAEREQLMSRLHVASQRIAPIGKQVDVVRQRLALEDEPEEGDDPLQPLRDALAAVEKAHQDALDRVWGKEKKVQGISRGNDGLLSEAQRHMRISSTDDAPNKTERDGMVRATRVVAEIEAVIATFVEQDLPTFRKAVADSGIGLLPK
ncbi:MAG: VPS10 domain-containing protein [Planctomycetota bacterium]